MNVFDPEKEDLAAYLRRQSGAQPVFSGPEQYRMLWDEGFISSGSSLRVYRESGLGDDLVFRAASRDRVEGSGARTRYLVSPKGEFSIEDVLDDRIFEAR